MLLSASVHMIILFFLALSQGNLYLLNYFNILDLDILFPMIFNNSVLGNIVALCFAGLLYILILKISESAHE